MDGQAADGWPFDRPGQAILPFRFPGRPARHTRVATMSDRRRVDTTPIWVRSKPSEEAILEAMKAIPKIIREVPRLFHYHLPPAQPAEVDPKAESVVYELGKRKYDYDASWWATHRHVQAGNLIAKVPENPKGWHRPFVQETDDQMRMPADRELAGKGLANWLWVETTPALWKWQAKADLPNCETVPTVIDEMEEISLRSRAKEIWKAATRLNACMIRFKIWYEESKNVVGSDPTFGIELCDSIRRDAGSLKLTGLIASLNDDELSNLRCVPIGPSEAEFNAHHLGEIPLEPVSSKPVLIWNNRDYLAETDYHFATSPRSNLLQEVGELIEGLRASPNLTMALGRNAFKVEGVMEKWNRLNPRIEPPTQKQPEPSKSKEDKVPVPDGPADGNKINLNGNGWPWPKGTGILYKLLSALWGKESVKIDFLMSEVWEGEMVEVGNIRTHITRLKASFPEGFPLRLDWKVSETTRLVSRKS